MQIHTKIPLEERFWPKVNKNGPNGCWIWIAGKNQYGYGMFFIRSKPFRQELAHRTCWQLLRGPIPEGLTIDHLCRNRACINPEHLEIVTMKENLLRGIGPGAINNRRKFCSKGHPLVQVPSPGYGANRRCMICFKEKQAIYRDLIRTGKLYRQNG